MKNNAEVGFLPVKVVWTLTFTTLASLIIELIVPISALVLGPLIILLGMIQILNVWVYHRKCRNRPDYVRIAALEYELGWDEAARKTVQEHTLPKVLRADIGREGDTCQTTSSLEEHLILLGEGTMTPEEWSQLSSLLSAWTAAGLSMSEMRFFLDSSSRTTSGPAPRAHYPKGPWIDPNKVFESGQQASAVYHPNDIRTIQK